MKSFLMKLSGDRILNNNIDRYIKDEISMLLSSRTTDSNLDIIPLVCDSVLNYGVKSTLPDEAEKQQEQYEYTAKLSTALNKYEPRLKKIKISHKYTNGTQSVCTVTANIYDKQISFDICWNKITDKYIVL
ncbi:hypothetical protein HIK39_003232 [Shigella dysenteriae]|nr:hypothetical protein [Escherichia coli]EFP6925557.1 hypothetical protein [Shigella dysenteriae]EJF5752641.1 GPW/gp25 family protein [Shigella sonnei]EFP8427465.1 hypothetical protein [Shigella dysenteriae]EGO3792038.1 hypothetical protein [Escherichia coli]